jgi:hypothetical protein
MDWVVVTSGAPQESVGSDSCSSFSGGAKRAASTPERELFLAPLKFQEPVVIAIWIVEVEADPGRFTGACTLALTTSLLVEKVIVVVVSFAQVVPCRGGGGKVDLMTTGRRNMVVRRTTICRAQIYARLPQRSNIGSRIWIGGRRVALRATERRWKVVLRTTDT